MWVVTLNHNTKAEAVAANRRGEVTQPKGKLLSTSLETLSAFLPKD